LLILRKYKTLSRVKIEKDIDTRGMVERYLYLAVQSTLDLAEAVISFKRLRKPATFSESFYILCEEHLVSRSLADKMAKLAGFRNILAHDYEKIDYDIVYDVLQDKLNDIIDFVAIIKKKLRL
jgi:uncharacterized protein YutE (UPF0331/DUF86 family)